MIKRCTAFIVLIFMLAMLAPPLGNVFAEDKQGENSWIILSVQSSYALVSGKRAQIDADLSVRPVILKERTFVPVRFVAEALEANVSWNPEGKVEIKKDSNTVLLTIGAATMLVNGEEKSLDSACVIENARTLVPLRAISEALGKEVFYDRGLIIIGEQIGIDKENDRDYINNLFTKVSSLPVLGSKEEAKEIFETLYLNRQYYRTGMAALSGAEATVQSAAPAPMAADSAKSTEAALSNEFSDTNIQVEGVDEADIIKTDGSYIYIVNQGNLEIVLANPAQNMQKISTTKISVSQEEERVDPIEMLISGDRLVVIASKYFYKQNYEGYAVAFVFDISDKANVVQIKEVMIEGSYTSSRRIGDYVYLISNHAIYYDEKVGIEETLPKVMDSAVGDLKTLDFGCIRYLPQIEYDCFINIAAFDINDVQKEANVVSTMASGYNVYASADHIYIAQTSSKPLVGTTEQQMKPEPDDNRIMVMPGIMPIQPGKQITRIYKFAISEDQVNFLYSGEVDGYILNQFSMDEHNGFFRIATTISDYNSKMRNSLYILDEQMKVCSRIEDIAPGERIYSTRFMGDRGYMVTFRLVDPLFAIDLSDPYNPKILGELKIPGYSEYLHPYDENHIIGFGKDSEEVNGNALDLGLKLAIFDVSDPTQPVELFVESIGDRGTSSQALYNHKAFLFSREKNLLIIPVELYENTDNLARNYGQFKYQGAYVYNIGLETGFNLMGRITHISSETMPNEKDAGRGYNVWQYYIQRALYIGDTIYTWSPAMLVANDLIGFTQISQVEFELPQEQYRYILY